MLPYNETIILDENAKQLTDIIVIMAISAVSVCGFILIFAVIKRLAVFNKVQPLRITGERNSDAFSIGEDVEYLRS